MWGHIVLMCSSNSVHVQVYLGTYVHRLRHRKMKPNLEDLKSMKNNLFNLRLELSKSRKSEPWIMKNLEKALKKLKKDKARDPNGWINEIFKDGVAGKDLKSSMLIFFNRMKAENQIPEFFRKADVATIYKGKGEKCDLTNDRGIFIVTIFRSNIQMAI